MQWQHLAACNDGALQGIYPRLGPTMEWDTAAGQCVAECAGAKVLDAQGAPLRYGSESLLNPHFIVVGGRGRELPALPG